LTREPNLPDNCSSLNPVRDLVLQVRQGTEGEGKKKAMPDSFPERKFLNINFNKRLETFAPCYSQYFLLADFKENHNSSLVSKFISKNLRNKKTRVYS
jgi:hypothetical protein